MGKNMITKMILTLGIIFALILTMVVLNEAILRHQFPAWSKSIVQMFFPPNDLYKPLLVEELIVSPGSLKKNTTYRIKYMGSYSVSLLFSNFGPENYSKFADKNNNFQLSAKIQCSVENNTIYTKSLNNGTPFLGKDSGGITLTTYTVPTDLPLDKSINCEFSIDNIDEEFITKHTPVKLSIAKMSDL